MSSFSSPARSTAYRSESTTLLLGKVLSLVAVALAFTALGTSLGRHLSFGTARICSFAGLGMLIVGSLAGGRFRSFRVGPFAITWLYSLAFLIGLGLGPVIAYIATANPTALTKAAGGTALTVLAMGSLGFTLSRDLSAWLRPLSLVVLVAAVVSILLLVTSNTGALSPVLSLVIYGVSALLIMVDLNVLRRYGGEDDAVWLATGIFVSIINIFISLLDLFGSD